MNSKDDEIKKESNDAKAERDNKEFKNIKAERDKEVQEAKEQLESLLNITKPRNLGEGLVNGVSTIVKGAIGGAGIAVLAPTVGLAAGTSAGGIIGGALGIVAGAVVGVVGGTAVAVSSTIGGVTQITQGIVSIPSSISKPSHGYWWNESIHQWVYTDMTITKKQLESIPNDDSDILHPYESDLDANSGTFKTSGSNNRDTIVDPYYYECLDIPVTAESSVIKRKYYLLAKQYHPDKVGVDDIQSAEKFKEIAEAYQVLIDPELRCKYDKFGRAGLSPDKTSTVDTNNLTNNIDPILLYSFLFGSDKFYSYIGRLSTATSSLIGDSTKITHTEARTLQERRVTRLAIYLIDKISLWVSTMNTNKNNTKTKSSSSSSTPANEILNTLEEEWKKEGIELSLTSYGYEMIITIGKIYNLLGQIYDGSVDSGHGLPSLSKWAKRHKATIDKKHDKTQTKIKAIQLNINLVQLQLELNEKLIHAQTDDERTNIINEYQTMKTNYIVQVLWTTVVIDITSTLYEVLQMILFDQSVSKDIRKVRSTAIQKLGTIWMSINDPYHHTSTSTSDDTTNTNTTKKTNQQLMEEAAFAAMIETVKRKDEASSHPSTTTTTTAAAAAAHT